MLQRTPSMGDFGLRTDSDLTNFLKLSCTLRISLSSLVPFCLTLERSTKVQSHLFFICSFGFFIHFLTVFIQKPCLTYLITLLLLSIFTVFVVFRVTNTNNICSKNYHDGGKREFCEIFLIFP